MKENNQLKNELNTANLELEQLESRFAMQVDEYEIEIENITQKLKEKENTVKVSLIYSQNFDTYIYIPEDLLFGTWLLILPGTKMRFLDRY